MRYRTIRVNGVDICNTYGVALDSYNIGEIKFDDNGKVESRENVFTFVTLENIKTWEETLLNLEAIFNHTTAKVEFPDDFNRYHEGILTISDKYPKSGHYYIEVKQVTDGYKYDKRERTLSTFDGTLPTERGSGAYLINNEGTAPARFEITNYSQKENGYLGIITEDSYYSIGDHAEADSIPIPDNKLVINEELTDLAHPGSGWRINQVQPPTDSSVATGAFSATRYGATMSTDIQPNWVEGKHWHGPSAVKRFDRDELNETWATAFHSRFRITAQSTDAGKQVFRCVVGILDEEDNFMFWVELRDGSPSYPNTRLLMYHTAHDRWTGDGKTLVTETNGRTNNFIGNIQFQKQWSDITYRAYHIPDNGYKNLHTKSGGWSFDRTLNQPQFDTHGRRAASIFIWIGRLRDHAFYDRFEITQARVMKKYWDGYGDVKNVLGPGDIFNLDTSTGYTYLNDYLHSHYGEVHAPYTERVNYGSDSAMELRPGMNHMVIERSPWYTGQDQVKIKYRPRFY